MADSPDKITFKYRKPGTCPPVFVAGTFSHPPWEPQLMEWTTDAVGEHTFAKTCEIDSGMEVQYKFRIGHDNWWVIDEEAPTTTDAAGNVNNVLNSQANASAQNGFQAQTPAAVEDVLQDAPPKQKPDKSMSATEANGHEEVAPLKEKKGKTVVFPCTPTCTPTESVRTADELAASRLDDARGHSEPSGSTTTAEASTFSQPSLSSSSNQVSDNEREADVHDADSRSEGYSDGTASTAVETVEPEADSELRLRRGSKNNGNASTSLPSLPDADEHVKERPAAGWFWSLINWIRQLVRSLVSWAM